jgi:hypothetical protein
MKKTKKYLAISLIVFGFTLFAFHLISFILSTKEPFIKSFIGYFTPTYSGSILLFVGIMIFSGVYLMDKLE